jgi:hypothetical protein
LNGGEVARRGAQDCDFTLKMEKPRFSETLASYRNTTRLHNPGDLELNSGIVHSNLKYILRYITGAFVVTLLSSFDVMFICCKYKSVVGAVIAQSV